MGCGAPFEAMRWKAEAGRVKYCSAACYRDQAATFATCEHCDVDFRVTPRRARLGQVRYCSHQCWQAGRPPRVTPVNNLIRKSAEYKAWREAVFERDDYTCQHCGTRGCYLEADHIKAFARHPELRFDVDNGRTLCQPCHRATPTFGARS